MVDAKDDEEVIDFMYRLVAGIIFAVANTAPMALNFYPILGELGSVSIRLAKICHWSPKLFELVQEGVQTTTQRWNAEDQLLDWMKTVKNTDIGGNLRLFVHQFVNVPGNIYDGTAQKDER